MLDRLAAVADPARAAVLLVDLQNDYCHPEGALGLAGADLRAVESIVAPLEHLLSGARAAAVPVIWIRNWHTRWTDSEAWQARSPGAGKAARADSWGAEFWRL